MRLDLTIEGVDAVAELRGGRLRLERRHASGPDLVAQLEPLDPGAAIAPFLHWLEGTPAKGLVAPDEAASVNALLDSMGLRLR